MCVCLCVFVCVEEADIWMLDGDDAISQTQISLNPASRPDHLDILRITPPEDDIIGDTPYYPGLECTVRAAIHHTYVMNHVT